MFRHQIYRIVRGHSSRLIWASAAVAILALAITTTLDADAGASDIGSLVLNVVLLLITATTLELAIAEPARLTLERQTELGLGDLLFFVVGHASDGTPRDILLQLHVAVANVGGTTAVLSSVELMGLLDETRQPVELGFGKVTGATYTKVVQWVETGDVGSESWQDSKRTQVRQEDYGPFILAPNDVVTLRIRRRRGIDWSAQWDVPQLKTVHDALGSPIRFARVVAKYRRADGFVSQEFDVPIVPQQQMLYREALGNITQGLTIRPRIDPMHFGEW